MNKKKMIIFIVLLGVFLLICGIIYKSSLNNKKIYLTKTEKYIEKINNDLAKKKVDLKLNKKDVSLAKESSLGNMNYIQYGILFNDNNDYISFVFDTDTGKILSVFVNEVKLEENEAYSKNIILSILNILKDEFNEEDFKSIKEKIETDENDRYTADKLSYYQYFVTENLDEGIEVENTYEIDFFEYTKEILEAINASEEDANDEN